jgi:hypothetical protein
MIYRERILPKKFKANMPTLIKTLRVLEFEEFVDL